MAGNGRPRSQLQIQRDQFDNQFWELIQGHNRRMANEQEQYRELQHSNNDLEAELSETKKEKDDIDATMYELRSHLAVESQANDLWLSQLRDAAAESSAQERTAASLGEEESSAVKEVARLQAQSDGRLQRYKALLAETSAEHELHIGASNSAYAAAIEAEKKLAVAAQKLAAAEQSEPMKLAEAAETWEQELAVKDAALATEQSEQKLAAAAAEQSEQKLAAAADGLAAAEHRMEQMVAEAESSALKESEQKLAEAAETWEQELAMKDAAAADGLAAAEHRMEQMVAAVKDAALAAAEQSEQKLAKTWAQGEQKLAEKDYAAWKAEEDLKKERQKAEKDLRKAEAEAAALKENLMKVQGPHKLQDPLKEVELKKVMAHIAHLQSVLAIDTSRSIQPSRDSLVHSAKPRPAEPPEIRVFQVRSAKKDKAQAECG